MILSSCFPIDRTQWLNHILQITIPKSISTMASFITCQKCTHGNKVTIQFTDSTYIFHAQWPHDADCHDDAARAASTAFCQQKSTPARASAICSSGEDADVTVKVRV